MADKKPSGLSVEVYRSQPKRPDGKKLTDRYDRLVLILPEGGPSEPSEEMPGVVLEDRSRMVGGVRKELMGPKSGKPYLNVVECDILHGPGRTAFGGNFIFTSDSRFPSDYPIPVHDQDPFGK